ncbi:neither inactivation nor afterpotential protein C-like [Macrosteles quadrilineatus]|uniref:neither inactivation nor afterpotential protein C-like n=1 Tax=Macrosteles quadrilineatus TaxID=74068 RepID=UPI0023E32B43|nr:neither inactivation nor afterpotential protein C-like [Macrosteles quadrilineatus]
MSSHLFPDMHFVEQFCDNTASRDWSDFQILKSGRDAMIFVTTKSSSAYVFTVGDHFFTTKTPKQRRASRKDRVAPPAPQLTYNYAQPGGSSDFNKGFNRPAAPSYQPPSPSKNFVNQQYNNDSGNNNYRDKLKPFGGSQNPIRELEMKFQQINNNKSDNEDEAPTFNFQAMLRKTNHNRASLRRSPEMEMANSHGYGSFPVIPEQRSVSQSNNNGYMNNNNNVVYNSSAMRNKNAAPKPFLRQDSGDCRKNMSHHYKESVKKARCDEVTTEIAPGIIIQGQVAEL